MTIADNGSFGIIRIIADRNKKAFDALKNNNLLVSLQDVIIVEIQDKVGAFHKIAQILEKNKINIEDAYGFTIEKGKIAALILKVKEIQKAEEILKKEGYSFWENI